MGAVKKHIGGNAEEDHTKEFKNNDKINLYVIIIFTVDPCQWLPLFVKSPAALSFLATPPNDFVSS